ncbi:hypothetical protein GWK47_054102 [Chionoecetes opilio]|uniref:Uncharacterized protein n=1 Tax=Chionoecetes opilio TaxID=41210 RepID=A0A8J4Y021_CHIOP|nr:hypothetical protein GWK47_054102 [Chionoecetes opilio]
MATGCSLRYQKSPEKVFTHALPISASWKSRRWAASFQSFAGAKAATGASNQRAHVDLSDKEGNRRRLDSSRGEKELPQLGGEQRNLRRVDGTCHPTRAVAWHPGRRNFTFGSRPRHPAGR